MLTEGDKNRTTEGSIDVTQGEASRRLFGLGTPWASVNRKIASNSYYVN
jgi:hypothetical protein